MDHILGTKKPTEFMETPPVGLYVLRELFLVKQAMDIFKSMVRQK